MFHVERLDILKLLEKNLDKRSIRKQPQLPKTWPFVIYGVIVFSLQTTFISGEIDTSQQVPSVNDCVSKKSSCSSAECYRTAANLFDAMDLHVDPCDNFYQYACGQKIQSFDKTSSNKASEQMNFRFKIITRIGNILEDPASKDDPPGLDLARAAYQACFDAPEDEMLTHLQSIWKMKWLPLEPYSDFLPGDPWDFLLHIFTQFGTRKGWMFSINVVKNFKQKPSKYVLQISQPKDDKSFLYFLSTIALHKERKARILFERHYRLKQDIGNLLNLFNFTVQNLEPLNDETKIPDRGERMTLLAFMQDTQLKGMLKLINGLFANVKTFDEYDEIFVIGKSYFTALGKRLKKLSSPRDVANIETLFAYYTIFMSDYVHPKNKISACLMYAVENFDPSLSRKYREKYFNLPSLRLQIAEMTDNIIEAFSERIQEMDWLEKNTKRAALLKLHSMKKSFIYPNWIDDDEELKTYYSNVHITSENHVQNMISMSKLATNKTSALIDKNDASRWNFPSILFGSAYYKLDTNYLGIMQGMLQSPRFFDNLAAVSYGILGSTIGHEIIHGYALKGIHFDSEGQYEQWMSDDELNEYNKSVQCFETQYSNYNLTSQDLPGISEIVQVNGSTTIDENIADNGGLRLAYRAFKKWSSHNKETFPEVLQNFTADQVFFVAYAQDWCERYWNASVMSIIFQEGDHSPAKFRVLGSTSNMKEFSDAFHCPRKHDPCILW